MSTLQKKYYCYSAGPGLFPRTLPNGHRETMEESLARVTKLNSVIEKIPEFKAITPTNDDLDAWSVELQARACCVKDLYLAAKNCIVFADVTPFGGREPDSGTVIELTTCALAGGLVVLWADPLTTFAERYADADVHPDSYLDKHYNLMLEQLYFWNWETHFGESYPVFEGLENAVDATATLVRKHDLERRPLLDTLNSEIGIENLIKTVKPLLG